MVTDPDGRFHKRTRRQGNQPPVPGKHGASRQHALIFRSFGVLHAIGSFSGFSAVSSTVS